MNYWNDMKTVSFGGVPAVQCWCDIYLWEAILNENPHLKRIIEFGTWMGGFSLFLDMQARTRDMTFFTYDSVVFRDDIVQKLPFTKLDIWANIEFLGDLISKEGTILFCDNGNKPREIKTFAPYLSSDSIVVVHDWMTETFPKDIPDYLEEIYGDFCDDIGSISRVFKRKV
jgi:cephalosporin hydroxylase